MSLFRRGLDWLDDRSGYRNTLKVALDEPVLGGASFAYVFGSVLSFIFILQATTGVLLAMYYSPSSSDAWASVAYIQDEVTLGWFIRGLHSHGASAMVIVSGLHMMQTALYGAYKKPRELNWIIGVLMLGLILGFALTGYLLPWDQTGYWATKVATGIAGTTPVAGTEVQAALQGGNEYGNLTLTRFFAIHVFILPGALIGLIVVHIALFRRHGVTPHWKHSKAELTRRTQPFWPDQLWKDMVAMALLFVALVAVNIYTHGASLDAPADPSSNFDARPEWYFRPLFQMLKYFEGPMEVVIALGVPPLVGGFLLLLPFLDRGEHRSPKKRIKFLALLGGGVVLTGALTMLSFMEDAGDPALQERLAKSEERAQEARALAKKYGVPPAGGYSVFNAGKKDSDRGAELFAQECASCHVGASRTGPEVGPGYNSRTWIHNFLLDPGGDLFFGVTKTHLMEPVTLRGAELAAVVEMIYKETGASDADESLAKKGVALFDDGDCSGCHSMEEDAEGDTGPNLIHRGSRAMLTDFIGNPAHPRWFGPKTEMPGFRDLFNKKERELIADYVYALQAKPYPHPKAKETAVKEADEPAPDAGPTPGP